MFTFGRQYPFGPLGEYHAHFFEPIEVDEGAQALLEKVTFFFSPRHPHPTGTRRALTFFWIFVKKDSRL
jgi:hypothetical protein